MDIEDNFVVKKSRKPSKASSLKKLEQQILESTLRIQQAKDYHKGLVEEYNALKSE